MAKSVAVVGFGANGVRRSREALLRTALFASTALAGVALANPVAAQVTVNPTGGGTITAPNNVSPTTITDSTSSGGGIQITNVDTNPPANPSGINITGVNYTNTTGAAGGPTADGYYAHPYGAGATRTVYGDSTNTNPGSQPSIRIGTTVSGGAAVELSSGTNLGEQFYANGNFSGTNGFIVSAPGGFINWQLNDGVTETVTGTGAAGSTGVNLSAASGATLNGAGGALNISAYATGVNATSAAGATVNTSGGGSISATTTGLLASAGSGTGAVSVISGSAITVGSGGTGISATTNGGAISVTTVAGGTIAGGAYGITATGGAATISLASSVAGSTNSLLLGSAGNAVTLNSGATLSGTADLGSGTNTLTLTGAGTNDTLAVNTVLNATSLVKTGTGTWTLTGAAGSGDFTGGTTISNGVLQVTAAALPAGAITDNATLAFVQGGVGGTFTPGISGGGAVTVSGVGAGNVLTFSGALTESGGIVVNDASTVGLTGSLNTGGNVAFNSTAGATLNNQGTIVALVGGVPGTASFSAGGTVVNGAAGAPASISGGYATLYDTGGALNVTNFGVLSANGYAIVAQGGNTTNPTSLTLNNTGKIVGGDVAVVANDATTSNSITNGGLIQTGTYDMGTGAVTASVTGSGVFVRTATTVINNAGGAIVGGTGTSSSDDAGVISLGGQLSVTNAGSIVGGYAGVQAAGSALISNSGTIATGSYATPTMGNPSGVTVGGAGFAIQIASGAVTNSGTLNSTGASINQTDTAGTLNLVNTGTIGGAGQVTNPDDTVVAEGAAIVLNSGTITTPNFYAVSLLKGGSVTNAAGGVISGGNAGGRYGVDVSGGGATVNNYGSITNTPGNGDASALGILTDNNAATINLYAGSTTGAITTGSGNDTLTLYNGRGMAGTATTTTYADAVSGATGTVTLQNAGMLGRLPSARSIWARAPARPTR